MAFCSALLRTKSTCLALFSALTVESAQCCASIIHLLIRVGSQPLPMRMRTNLKISVSPMGFLRNMSRISFGHDFKGKNASLVNCLLCSTASARDSKRVSSRYRRNVAITRPFEKCSMKAAILHHGLNTLNYNFVTFPRQKGWLFGTTVIQCNRTSYCW